MPVLRTQEAAAQDAEERAHVLALPAPAAAPANGDGADPANLEHAAGGPASGRGTAGDGPSLAGAGEQTKIGMGAPDSEGGEAAEAAAEPMLTAGTSVAEHEGSEANAGQQQDSTVGDGQGAVLPEETAAEPVGDTQVETEPDTAAAGDTEPEGDADAEEPAASEAPAEEEVKPEDDTEAGATAPDSADAEATIEQAAGAAKQAVSKPGGASKQSKKNKKRKKGRLAIAAAAALRRQTRGATQAEARPHSAEPGTSKAGTAAADAEPAAIGGADSPVVTAIGNKADDADEAAVEDGAGLVAEEKVGNDAPGTADEEQDAAAEEGAADPDITAVEDGQAGADATVTAGALPYIIFDGLASARRPVFRWSMYATEPPGPGSSAAPVTWLSWSSEPCSQRQHSVRFRNCSRLQAEQMTEVSKRRR